MKNILSDEEEKELKLLETNRKLLGELLSDLRDPPLREFLRFVFSPENLLAAFLKSPASRRNHHAYAGGLAHHSIQAAILSKSIVKHYKLLGVNVNEDIVVAGILLHDIGKIGCYIDNDAFCSRRKMNDSNDDYECGHEPQTKYHHVPRAALMHHIPMGAIEISRLADKFNRTRPKVDHMLRAKKIDKLVHIILSHHGRKSWSSPVTPQFIEAYIVHIVESMDGYIEKFNSGEIPRSLYDN